MKLKNTASRKKCMRDGDPLMRMWLTPRGFATANISNLNEFSSVVTDGYPLTRMWLTPRIYRMKISGKCAENFIQKNFLKIIIK